MLDAPKAIDFYNKNIHKFNEFYHFYVKFDKK